MMAARIVIVAWLSAAASAYACDADAPPPEESFATASAVFVAHITRTEETTAEFAGSAGPQEAVRAHILLIDVLKGIPPLDGTIVSPVPRSKNCGFPLLAGSDFLFFLHGGANVALLSDGSFPIWDVHSPHAREELQRLRSLNK